MKENSIKQSVLAVVSVSLMFSLSLSVERAEASPKEIAIEALHALTKKGEQNNIIVSRGIYDYDFLSVSPDGARITKVTSHDVMVINAATKSKKTRALYLSRWNENTLEGTLLILPNLNTQEFTTGNTIQGLFFFDISPDENSIAYSAVSLERGAPRFDLKMTNIKKVAPVLLASGNASAPRWSPDGKSVLFSHDGKIAIASVETKGVKTIPGAEGNFPDWFPNGKQILFNKSGIITSFDLTTGKSRDIVDSGYKHTIPRISPDGRFVAYAGIKRPAKGRHIYVFDMLNNVEVQVLASDVNCDVHDW